MQAESSLSTQASTSGGSLLLTQSDTSTSIAQDVAESPQADQVGGALR